MCARMELVGRCGTGTAPAADWPVKVVVLVVLVCAGVLVMLAR